eukprot:g2145.t1
MAIVAPVHHGSCGFRPDTISMEETKSFLSYVVNLAKIKVPVATKVKTSPSKLFLITDKNVAKNCLHEETLNNACEKLNLPRIPIYVCEPGEATKCRSVHASITDWLLDQGCKRDSVLLALGGGVIGDLTGYVAATFMRGIRYIQMPTSLLAMVDSSIGGKTGIDTPMGKNLVGAFWNPLVVYTDLNFLKTLPIREMCNGMAEIIKAGAMKDEELFQWCEQYSQVIKSFAQHQDEDEGSNNTGVIAPSSETTTDTAASSNNTIPPMLSKIILRAQNFKLNVCKQDVHERGLRSILNFGHTIGHGIEALMQPDLLHGECVAIGMIKEAELARALGVCTSTVIARLARCCKLYDLPTTMPKRLAKLKGDESVEAIIAKMQYDKKNTSGLIKGILIEKIGNFFTDPVTWPPRSVAASVAAPSTTTTKKKVITHVFDNNLVKRILSNVIHVQYLVKKKGTQSSTGIDSYTIRVPGSKSLSNRVLYIAAMATGETKIYGLLNSDDTEVMMTALRRMGASFQWFMDTETKRPYLLVRGTGGKVNAPAKADTTPIYLGNAGTATRFLTSLITLANTGKLESSSSLPNSNSSSTNSSGSRLTTAVEVTGSDRMLVRPIGPLVDCLRLTGAKIDYLGKTGYLPLRIHFGDTYFFGKNSPIARLEASVSSQYVSSILLASPIALQKIIKRDSNSEVLGDIMDVELGGGTTGGSASTVDLLGDIIPQEVELNLQNVKTKDDITSLKYIEMTVKIMEQFGVKVEEREINRYVIKDKVGYRPPKNSNNEGEEEGRYEVEADASSATYPLAFAAVTGTEVTVEGVGASSVQGDAAFCDLLRKMGCHVNQTDSKTTVRGPDRSKNEMLKAIPEIVDMGDLTDAFMTLVAVACCAEGTTRIRGIANQHVKECDRIKAMCTELGKLGFETKNLPDGIDIVGKGQCLNNSGGVGRKLLLPESSSVLIHCYDDHRIAMSFAVLACNVEGGLTLDDKACTAKTYPEFWDDVNRKLQVTVECPLESENVNSNGNEGQEISSNQQYQDNIKQTSFPTRGHGGFFSEGYDCCVLIGMRGVGKTSLAQSVFMHSEGISPEAFKAKYTMQQEEGKKKRIMNDVIEMIDMDQVFVENLQCESIAAYIAANGWSKFREQEVLMLAKEVLGKVKYDPLTKDDIEALCKSKGMTNVSEEDILKEKRLRWKRKTKNRKLIVSCGGGIVETEQGRRLLKAFLDFPGNRIAVVHVERDIQAIEDSLDLKQQREAYQRIQGKESKNTKQAKIDSTSEMDEEDEDIRNGLFSNLAAANDDTQIISEGQNKMEEEKDNQRPAYANNESLKDCFKRRRPLFENCSSHHFYFVSNMVPLYEEKPNVNLDQLYQNWNLRAQNAKQGIPYNHKTGIETSTGLPINRPLSQFLTEIEFLFFLLQIGFLDDYFMSFFHSSHPSKLQMRCPFVEHRVIDLKHRRKYRTLKEQDYYMCLTAPSYAKAIESSTRRLLFQDSMTSGPNRSGIELRMDLLKGGEKFIKTAQKVSSFRKDGKNDSKSIDELRAGAIEPYVMQYAKEVAHFRAAQLWSYFQCPMTLLHGLQGNSIPPLVYTIRTSTQGGKFDFSDDVALYDNLLKLGPRLGVDYIDIEVPLKWNNDRSNVKVDSSDVRRLKQLCYYVNNVNKGRTSVILSYHNLRDIFDPTPGSATQKEVTCFLDCFRNSKTRNQNFSSSSTNYNNQMNQVVMTKQQESSSQSSALLPVELVDIVKLVMRSDVARETVHGEQLSTSTSMHNIMKAFKEEVKGHTSLSLSQGKPIKRTSSSHLQTIGIVTGPAGVLSRVLNTAIGPTPVCAPRIPSLGLVNPAAPGQPTRDVLSKALTMFGYDQDSFYKAYFGPYTSDYVSNKRRKLSDSSKSVPFTYDAALTISPKKLYILGTPVDKSPSPDMHNAAFEHEYRETIKRRMSKGSLSGLLSGPNLSHDLLQSLQLKNYSRRDFATAEKKWKTANPTLKARTMDTGARRDPNSYESMCHKWIRDIVNEPSFLGANVTIPLKEYTYRYLLEEGRREGKAMGLSTPISNLSTAARTIKAVNTLWKQPETGMLLGDNTDWIGINSVFGKLLRGNDHIVYLIVGAGGTARAACYAAQNGRGDVYKNSARMELFVTNRTASKGESLASEFGGSYIAPSDLENVFHKE